MRNLAPLTITLNDVDVTECYTPKAGAIEVTDSLNQPLTCGLSFSSLKLLTPIQGGELLTVQDPNYIYFDGVVPVEGGVGTDFLYLDTSLTPEAYRKMVKITGSDYQTVLDYKNLPERVFYDQNSGSIVKALIELGPLAGRVDYTGLMDGYQIPIYAVGGRKFSNVVKELAAINGYYFAIRTKSIVTDEDGNVTRQFAVEFRPLSDRPAPFSIDRDANKYQLQSLRFSSRDKPLINKITIVGGVEPSDDVQVDEFMCDDDSGQFVLTKVPFTLKTSELFTSDFSQAVADMKDVVVGFTPSAFTSGPTVDNELHMNGSATFCFVPAFKSREQRYTTFEEIMLDSGSSFVCGLFSDSTPEGADCKLGVWFKPDGTITYINNGAEGAPRGNPTWSPRTDTAKDNIYSVRVKETDQGTMCEIQGGDLSPVRHWLPLQPPGDCATALMHWSGIAKEGATIDLQISGITVPRYTLDADDAADASLWTLHENLIKWIGSVDAISRRWWVTEQSDYFTFTNITRANPAVATVSASSDIQTGDWVSVEGLTGSWSALNNNRYKAERIDATHFKLVGLDTTDFATYPVSGWCRHYHNGILFSSFKDGTENNLGVVASINPLNGPGDDPATFLGFSFSTTPGTERGANFSSLPDNYYAGLIIQGSGAVHRIIVRDPVGVDVQLERSEDNVLQIMQTNPDLVDAQRVVSLTVGSKDEVAEQFSATVALEGSTAILSFFDDEASLPQKGDIVRIAYRYGVPIRVLVQDHTSVNMVKARSKVPGDDGIREGQDIDLQDKVFSHESAVRYGTQYLSTRSGLSLQGSVQTDSILTLGAVPQSGQTLAFCMTPDSLAQAEVVSQVTMRHKGFMNAFDYTVAFGNVPDEFLLPTESPNIRNGPDAYTYNVQNVVERIKLAEEKIKLTVV